jgi:predicted HicB family RNase H-like nuclease
MSENVLTHKGYKGSVEYSPEDRMLVGKILDIDGLVMYYGESVPEISRAFITAVDDYLAECERARVEPQKPYSGTFNVRVSGELHRTAASVARRRGQSLNALVKRALEMEVVREDVHVETRIVSLQKEEMLVSSPWPDVNEPDPEDYLSKGLPNVRSSHMKVLKKSSLVN